MKNELAFHNKENALTVASLLLEESYVVMLSSEETLTILNYEETYEFNEANRNGVVFMHREEFEDKYYEKDEEEETKWNTM